MQDKVILITGGSSGMGKGMAKKFIDAGANVIITGRNQERLDQAEQEINNKAALHTVRMDVRSPEEVAYTVADSLDHFGKIDGLVNNAAGNFRCPSEDLTINGWNSVMDIVLNGTWYCTQAVAKEWIKNKQQGAIVNMVATTAWMGSPETVHSASAKAGVLTMTKTLAVEWGRKYGIRVNAMAPGLIEDTGGAKILFESEALLEQAKQSIPLGRLGKLDEVANLAIYLLSAQGAYMNGECITMDGAQWLQQGYSQ